MIIVVAVVTSYLGNNPRQNKYCSQKKMSARANCRMCTRVQSNSITHLGRMRKKNFNSSTDSIPKNFEGKCRERPDHANCIPQSVVRIWHCLGKKLIISTVVQRPTLRQSYRGSAYNSTWCVQILCAFYNEVY
jgi:hypothetical protein